MLLGLLLFGLASVSFSAQGDQHAASILEPLIRKYQDLIYAERWGELQKLYHPNAVLVVNAWRAILGPQKIFDEIKKQRADLNGAKTVFLKEWFAGDGSILMYSNQWKINTGDQTLTGPYRAIWVKQDGNYVILHEEFSTRKQKKF